MSLMLDKIDELLEQYDEWQGDTEAGFGPAPTETKPKFEVTDKSSAEWVMRKIAKLQEQVEENSAITKEQLAPLEAEKQAILAWEEAELAKIIRRQDFLKSLLEPFHRKLLEVDPKAKTIKLPHGEMRVRSQQPEFKRDDEKLLKWIKETQMNDHLMIKVKETPDWALIKTLTTVVNGKVVFEGTGEVLEGVTAIERPDKFEVVVK